MSESAYPPLPNRLLSGGGGDYEPYYPSSPESGGQSETAAPPPGPGFNRQEFIKSYAGLVARTWVDDAYLDLIVASPAATLAKAGLPTPDGATIRVIQAKVSGSGQVRDQVDAWVEGMETGLFDLYLPLKPDDIDFGPGGGAVALRPTVGDRMNVVAINRMVATDNSCCCTPCCCCT